MFDTELDFDCHNNISIVKKQGMTELGNNL